MNSDMIACVDLGSNSFRLQVSRNSNGQPQVLDSIKEMVRLAAGLDEDKILSKDAQERALSCLAKFAERLRGFSKNQVRVVATNTFRVAKNIDSFIPKAEKALGFPIEVIAGREEARLIYTGVVHTLPFEGRKALIVDIGGGSTEFIVGKHLQPELTESLPLGCVSYTMRYFQGNHLSTADFQNAINAARLEIQRIRSDIKKSDWDFAIGTSGSAKCIRDVMLTIMPEHENITLAGMHFLMNKIIQAGNTKKAKFEGMKPERVEVFAGGLAVMMAVFEELNIKEMICTDVALREGVFYDFVGRQFNQDMREETVGVVQQRYYVDMTQAQRVEKFATMCFEGLSLQFKKNEWSYWAKLISWSARLHEIGLTISHTGYHKHSSYIIEYADMPGFSRKDQNLLSLLVLGHRGDLKKMIPHMKKNIMISAILCLRLSVLIYRGRKDIAFPEETSLHFNAQKKKCVFKINKHWLEANPLTASALYYESNQWAKIGYDFVIKKISD